MWKGRKEVLGDTVLEALIGEKGCGSSVGVRTLGNRKNELSAETGGEESGLGESKIF